MALDLGLILLNLVEGWECRKIKNHPVKSIRTIIVTFTLHEVHVGRQVKDTNFNFFGYIFFTK